ncbi:Crp/Fnr family transcriptional regulator [Zobellia alginiliquefaciens]|uniref:Crp/Fnr family transcriptional regulator n=1 Tax=Zobellia alginiliquefaciens TaxID=3032586 RepID=UPI0023E324B8|nr:cyclic nucleotide-binding domain-containing protein [Zobellia alginiliquefaciens]
MISQDNFLNNIFTPSNFSDEELATIIPKFKKVTFSKNDFILEEGKTENHYWFIESGFARSYVMNTEGKDISTNFYAVGDIVIDWTSFFLRNPTRENIQALTDCVCWQLDFDTFQELFHSIRSFREQGRTTLVNSYFALKKQSVAMIADQASERYLKLLREKPHIIQNISLKHIATYLGVTDTSLSRIRKEISGE